MTQFKGCLKGSRDPVQAARTIEFLTRLGGVNNIPLIGNIDMVHYYINANGKIDWTNVGIPSGYTLITLQKDCLLPVSWCVKACSTVARYLGKIDKCYWNDTFDGYLGIKDGNPDADRQSWDVLLSESQFLALTAPSTKEEREIEGYVCPMDIGADWNLKKGDILALSKGYGYTTKQSSDYLPAEIVETWEPRFREEKIIIAGKDVQLKNEYIIYNESTFSALTIRQVLNELNLFGATHLAISGEQVPVSTLEKILAKLK